MTKYDTTLKIRAREKIPDLLSILEGLFYRKPENAKVAQNFVYMLIERKRIPASEWAGLQKELDCTHQEYYTTLSKLRGAGMIAKVNGEWILSEQFGSRCSEMSEIWASFIKRWKEGKRD
jgi:hypothetical protein